MIKKKILKKILENTKGQKESEEMAQKCLLFTLENSKKFSKLYLDEHATQICMKFLFSKNLNI